MGGGAKGSRGGAGGLVVNGGLLLARGLGSVNQGLSVRLEGSCDGRTDNGCRRSSVACCRLGGSLKTSSILCEGRCQRSPTEGLLLTKRIDCARPVKGRVLRICCQRRCRQRDGGTIACGLSRSTL